METTLRPLRVFLSYGRDEYAHLAVKLKADLESRGHSVWFDQDRLKEGGDWERYIEEGLQWVGTDRESGRIVFVMTPHSVRRPDGYCLNEIAMALTKKVDIVPVMLMFCEPPLSIYRLQYLDMQECWPPDAHPGPYAAKFQRLLAALEDRAVDFGGPQATILNRLKPIEFRAELIKLLDGFTGRQWVFAEFDRWVCDPQQGSVFWITGAPGVGKSAIAAWLRENRREIAAFHFCDAFSEEKRDPAKLVTSVACQLATQLPAYQERLAKLDLTDILERYREAYTLFDLLIVQPMSDLDAPDRTVVILIDALDEATVKGTNQIATFISQSFAKAPAWLRLCITSRPEIEITTLLRTLDPFVLDTTRPENLADLRVFLGAYPFKDGRRLNAVAVEQIVTRSEGLFLYAHHVCAEIDAKRLSPDRPEEFPRGLGEVYQKFFARKFKDEGELATYKRTLRPLLAMMVAAYEPLNLGFLQRVLAIDRQDLFDLFDLLGALCVVTGETRADTARFFHRSIRDWLTVKADAGHFFIDGEAGHSRLAEFGWNAYAAGPATLDGYVLAWLPSHLSELKEWTKVETVLCDILYLEARAKAGSLDGLQRNYEQALKVMPSSEERVQVDDFAALFMRQKHVLSSHPELTFQQLYNEQQWKKGRTKEQAEKAKNQFLSAGGKFFHQYREPKTKLSHLITTLEGHSAEVESCAYSPDGQRIVSGSWDNTLKIWDAETGRAITILKGHSERVVSCAYSPDSRRIVSGSYDKTLKIWDAETGREITALEGYSEPVTSCAYSPDGRRIVSASWDKTLKIWDAETGRAITTLKGHFDLVTSCAYSPDGRRIVSASGDNTLKIWDAETGREIATLQGHTWGVTSCAYSPDGQRIVSGSWDNTLKIWDAETGREMCALEGHSDWITSCAYSPDGRRILSGSMDTTLKIWDVETGRAITTLEGHSNWVTSCAYSPDGRRIVSASVDNTLKIWDAETGREIATLQGHSGGVTSCAYSPDCRRIVSASGDNTLKIWDAETGREIATLQGHTWGVTSCAYSPDGQRIVSGSWDNTLKIWDAETGRAITILKGHSERVVSCAYSPDGRRIVSASSDKTLKIWDAETGRAITTLEGHSKDVTSCAYSPDGRRIVSGSWDNTLKIWDAKTGREITTFEGHSKWVTSCAYSPDGRRIVSSSYDKTLKIWDAETGREITTLEGHSHFITSCAYSPDGQLIVSASDDKTLRIWNTEKGQELAIFVCDSRVYCCTVSPCGAKIVCGDSGGNLYFLELVGFDPCGER